MARSTGIELLEKRVRVLVLETGGKRPKIAGFVELPITVAPEEEWAPQAVETLKEACAQAKAPKGRAVLNIESGAAILRELTIPFKDPDQVRAVVPNELESLVHNYAIEDLVVDFIATGETEKATKVLAAAVPHKVMKERLDIAMQAGIDPIAMDLDVPALFNALDHLGAVDTEEPFLILHGTPRFSKLVLVENKKPRSIRTIRFSLPNPEEEKKAQDEQEQAREWQTTEVPGPVPIVVITTSEAAKFSELDFETRSSLMEILAKEISRFLLANASGSTPVHMLVTGEFEDEESAALLEAATNIPTKTFPMLEKVEHSFRADEVDVETKLHVPMGLALKAAGQDSLGMDFRKGPFVYKKKFDTVKTTALVTIELIIVFLAALALHFYFRARDLRDYDIGDIHQRQDEIHEIVLKEKASSPDKAYKELRARMSELENTLGQTSDFPLKQTALEIAGRLFKAIKAFQTRNARTNPGGQPIWVEIETVDISQVTRVNNESLTVKLRAKARNHMQLDAFKKELAKVELFTQVKEDGQIKSIPDGIQFALVCTTKEQ